MNISCAADRLFHQNIFNETGQIEEIQRSWEKLSILAMIDGHNRDAALT